MFRSRCACFTILVFLCCAVLTCAAKDVPLPDELYSAKSVALVVQIVGKSERSAKYIADYKVKVATKAADEIEKQKRFDLVSDPGKADLVFVLVSYWGPYFLEGKSIWNHTSSTLYMHPPQTLMVFRGGNHPQWNPEPLWLETESTSQSPSVLSGLIKDLHKKLKKPRTTENSATATAGSQSPQPPNDAKPANEDASPANTEAPDASAGAKPASAGQPDGVDAQAVTQKSATAQAATEKNTEEKNAAAEEKESPEPEAKADATEPMLFCWSDFKKCHPVASLYSAKTVYVYGARNFRGSGSGKDESDKIKALFQPSGRWSLVDDPRQADLVMILGDQLSNDPVPGGLVGAFLGGSQVALLYLLKGGPKPDWDSMLVFTTIGGGGLFSKVRSNQKGTVLDNLQKFLSDTQSAPANSSAQSTAANK